VVKVNNSKSFTRNQFTGKFNKKREEKAYEKPKKENWV
jgi:hypothetical protein